MWYRNIRKAQSELDSAVQKIIFMTNFFLNGSNSYTKYDKPNTRGDAKWTTALK